MHDMLTEQDVQDLLVDWVEADAPIERWTSVGRVVVEPEGAVHIDGERVFDLHAHLRGMVVASAVDAICADCGLEHTVEPDARQYPCEACGGDDTVTSPLVIVGYA